MRDHRSRQIVLTSTLLCIGLLIVVMPDVVALSFRALDQAHIYIPVVNPRPIATEPPPGDLLLQGTVYDRLAGPISGIQDAQVSIISCVGGRRYSTASLSDGSFALIVPQAYVNPCTQLTLETIAVGYVPQSAVLSVTDLRANPRLNIALRRVSTIAPSPTATPGNNLTISGGAWR